MKLKNVFLLVALVIASCTTNEKVVDINPVLTIEGGKIKGLVLDSTDVIVYRGIPYAAAPVGDLRWKAPQAVTPWDTVMIADSFSCAAIQRTRNPQDGQYGTEFHFRSDDPKYSEDCLYLNVWTPTSAVAHPEKKLPVAMWIHGGAFGSGWGFEMQMDGEAWAKREVILVTINYRLSSLGFVSHPDLSAENLDRVSGNYGLLDQIAALKWIKKNISNFGGNPENITIFGQSAGGASVRYLCTSPLSKGLISRAIIQSGGGLGGTPMGIQMRSQEEYDEKAKTELKSIGFESIAELRALSVDSLYKVSEKLAMSRKLSFSPHLDGVVLDKSFDEAVYDGSVANVPYMIGYTSGDMGPRGMESILKFAQVRDSVSHKPTYCYQFDRELPNDGRECLQGAFHSSELWYMFNTLKRSWRPFTEADYQLSEEMVDAWTNFAKYGNPNGESGNDWAPATKNNPFIKYLRVKE